MNTEQKVKEILGENSNIAVEKLLSTMSRQTKRALINNSKGKKKYGYK